METLLFCKQHHMTIAKMKALRSPTPLIADTLLASLLLPFPQTPPPRRNVFEPLLTVLKKYIPQLFINRTTQLVPTDNCLFFLFHGWFFVTCHRAVRQHHINDNAFPSCTTIPYCNNTYPHLTFQQPAHIHLSRGKECLGVWLGSLPSP